MTRPILLVVSLILGLAALSLLTSVKDDAASTGAALRSLRSSSAPAPERDMVWKGDEDGGLRDMLARESARLDRERSAATEPERTRPAAAAKKQAASAATGGNDHGEDRNDRQQAQKHGSGADANPTPDHGAAQRAEQARPNQPAVDQQESDRTFDHLLEKEAAHHSTDASQAGGKTLHLIIPGMEPSHLPHIYAYTKKRAGRQGWNTRVWKGMDVDQLVKDEYAHLEKVWVDVKKTPEREERQKRMGDFMKLVAIHSQGGVYLDADLVPCAGLDELIGGVHGPPHGIMSLPYGPEGANRAFAAPAKHPVLTLALKSLDAAAGGADGDLALRIAVSRALSVPVSAPPGAEPKTERGWTTHASVRVGSFTLERSSPSPSGSELDLWHLDLSAGGGREFLSKCVKDTEDIAPFLEEGCRSTPSGRGKFEDCGRTIA